MSFDQKKEKYGSISSLEVELRCLKFYPVFELPAESKLVFGFAVRDFVSSEPVNSRLQVSGFVPPHVIDICSTSARRKHPENDNSLSFPPGSSSSFCGVSFFPTVIVGGIGVIGIDHNDLPVRFSLINQSQRSQHLYFDYFPSRAHLEIKGVV